MLLALLVGIVMLAARFEHLPPLTVAGSWASAAWHAAVKTIEKHETPATHPVSAPPTPIPTGSDLMPAPAPAAQPVQPSEPTSDQTESDQTASNQPPNPAPETANYLEPSDPTLQPGERRMDGLLVGPVDTDAGQLKMHVLWVIMPLQRRAVLPAPRTKLVSFDSGTLITVNGRTATLPLPDDLASRPVHVTAIGPDSDQDRPFNARSIDFEPASDLETGLCDEMQNAADTILNETRKSPDISLERARIIVDGVAETVQYVRAAPGTFRIAVGIAGGKVGATESLDSIAKRCGAIAAINGSFFDCYAPGPIKMPDHPLISGGRMVSRGDIGSELGQTPDGEMRFDSAYSISRWHEFDPVNPSPVLLQSDRSSVLYWARVTEALGCGPRLVANGAAVSLEQEGFTSAEVLTGVSVRSAVGVTANGGLILIVTHASLPQLADIMFQLGCRDAMNLDGGASSGLWLRGKPLREPGRLLSNALLIEAR
jgi:exopolysaccharide biosynthesis protein